MCFQTLCYFALLFLSNFSNNFVRSQCFSEENDNYTLPKHLPFSYRQLYDSYPQIVESKYVSIHRGKVDFNDPSYKCSKNENNRNGICNEDNEQHKMVPIENAIQDLKVTLF